MVRKTDYSGLVQGPTVHFLEQYHIVFCRYCLKKINRPILKVIMDSKQQLACITWGNFSG